MEETGKENALKIGRKKLYPYQESDIEKLFEKLEQNSSNHRLLYRLPTGGGKTVIFSQIVQRFIKKYNRKVIVLTHRIELCKQTSATLKNLGVSNKMIDSSTKQLNKKDGFNCYVAMVTNLDQQMKSLSFFIKYLFRFHRLNFLYISMQYEFISKMRFM